VHNIRSGRWYVAVVSFPPQPRPRNVRSGRSGGGMWEVCRFPHNRDRAMSGRVVVCGRCAVFATTETTTTTTTPPQLPQILFNTENFVQLVSTLEPTTTTTTTAQPSFNSMATPISFYAATPPSLQQPRPQCRTSLPPHPPPPS
jgi:hypothetical protein